MTTTLSNRILSYLVFYAIIPNLILFVIMLKNQNNMFPIGQAMVFFLFFVTLNMVVGYKITKHIQPNYKEDIKTSSFFICYGSFALLMSLSIILVNINKLIANPEEILNPIFSFLFGLGLLSGVFYWVGSKYSTFKRK